MTSSPETVARLDELDRRIGRLEQRIRDLRGSTTDPALRDLETSYCCLPLVPERRFEPEVSEHRAELLRTMGKKWANRTQLRYAFFGSGLWAGPESEKALVREGFEVWNGVGIGIRFDEVQELSEAEIRIGFLQDGRTWSYLGRDVIDIPGQSERTMNFGWRIGLDPRRVDVPVHEIGHTLGFPHEHQNPFAGIVWDEEAVYRYFARQGWSRQTTRHNVLGKLPPGTVEGSDWDPDSIMHYGFPAGLILQPESYRTGLTPQLGLTDTDRSRARAFYPPGDDTAIRKLAPLQLERLDIGPGEQVDFLIEPTATREYTMQTFGRADTLMVLFEERAGRPRFVAGDDDSGTRLNARISQRLYPGRRYVLRLRLYLNWASGETAVMLW